MFNVYKFENNVISERQTIQDPSQNERLIFIKNKKRDEMSKKYRDRVAEFIKEMAQKPVVVKDYYERQPTADKLQKSVFRFTYNSSQKERIAETSKNQSFFESEPLDLYKKGFLLRPREPEKEIGPQFMKFKAISTVERVFDSVNTSLQSTARDKSFYSVQTSPLRSSLMIMQKNQSKQQSQNNNQNTSYLSPKALLLPELHQKTHFKGATSILMQHQGSLHLEKEELNRQFMNGASGQDIHHHLNNSIDVSLKKSHTKNAKTMALNSQRNTQNNFTQRHGSIDQKLQQDSVDMDSTNYIKHILLDCKILRQKNGNVGASLQGGLKEQNRSILNKKRYNNIDMQQTIDQQIN
eukprot:403349018